MKLERAFKRSIVIFFVLLAIVLFAAIPSARFGARRLVLFARERALGAIGDQTKREPARVAETRRAEEARRALREMFAKTDAKTRHFLTVAGMAPEDAILGRGNIDQVIFLSSKVFQTDETRSYRLLPKTRSVWVRGVAFGNKVLAFYLVPDAPEVREAAKSAGIEVMEWTVQTTNSWGLRGPEPDLKAKMRGIVVGDSFMQGVFVADDETPPERLRRHLEKSWNTSVSVLNLGHLGYSPDQYESAFNASVERFRPDFVVLGVCPNDFGDIGAVLHQGKGNWNEAKERLGAIHYRCRVANAECVLVPIPWVDQMRHPRESANYPGELERVANFMSLDYCDPIEDFVNASLRVSRAAERAGKPYTWEPLYNGRILDHHLSPIGADVWGESVARRIALRVDPIEREQKP